LAGELKPDDLGYYQGCVDWVPLRQIPGVFDEEEENTEEAQAGEAAPPEDQPEDTESEKPHPWLRLAARTLDMVLFSLVLGVVIDLFLPSLRKQANEQLALLSLPLMALVEPLFLSRSGATPGKWLMNMRVTTLDGSLVSLPQAYSRSILVWIFGLGLGLPFISLATMLFAYFTLARGKSVWWDRRAATRVEQGPIVPVRMVMAAVIIGLTFGAAFYVLLASEGVAR